MRRVSLWCTAVLMGVFALALVVSGCGGGSSSSASSGPYGRVTIKVVDDQTVSKTKPIITVRDGQVLVRGNQLMARTDISLVIDFYRIIDDVAQEESAWNRSYDIDESTTEVVADQIPANQLYRLVGRYFEGSATSPYAEFYGDVYVSTGLVTATVTSSPMHSPTYAPPGNVVEVLSSGSEVMAGHASLAANRAADAAYDEFALVYSVLEGSSFSSRCQIYSGINPEPVWGEAYRFCTPTYTGFACLLPIYGAGVCMTNDGILIHHANLGQPESSGQWTEHIAYYDRSLDQWSSLESISKPGPTAPETFFAALTNLDPVHWWWGNAFIKPSGPTERLATSFHVHGTPNEYPYSGASPTPAVDINEITYDTARQAAQVVSSNGVDFSIGWGSSEGNLYLVALHGDQKTVITSETGISEMPCDIDASISDNYLAVVWSLGSKVYMRRYAYTEAGVLTACESEPVLMSVNSTSSTLHPAVSVNNSGQAVAVWMDWSREGIITGKDFVGATIGAPGLSTTPNTPFLIGHSTHEGSDVGIDVSANEQGRFVVTWETGHSAAQPENPDSQVYVRNYPIEYGSNANEDPFDPSSAI